MLFPLQGDRVCMWLLWSNEIAGAADRGFETGDVLLRTTRGRRKTMANLLLPIEERTLTPDEVELLDRRRRRGQLFLVLCFMCLIIGTLVTIWAGQDATYSPGWARPMVYWDAITVCFWRRSISGWLRSPSATREHRVSQLLGLA